MTTPEPPIAAPESAVGEVAANEWRPIETAPKDGTRILAWCRGASGRPGCQMIAWREWTPTLSERTGWYHTGWTGPLGGALADDFYGPSRPILWMPLPEPPSDGPLATTGTERSEVSGMPVNSKPETNQ